MEASFDFRVTLADRPEAEPVCFYHLSFVKDDKKAYLQYTPKHEPFRLETTYNPVRSTLWISADTLDAEIAAGAKPAAAEFQVASEDGKVVHSGRVKQFVQWKYEDLVQIPPLAPGKYQATVRLVDSAGAALAVRDDVRFEKKDEPAVFAKWWGNRIGQTQRVLKPFEPLKVAGGLLAPVSVSPIGRQYTLDAVGLPQRIVSNGGDVLTAPARLVLVIDGVEHVVPTRGTVRVTSRKDWRVEFAGRAEAAGVVFDAVGWIEQDGLADIRLTYAPKGAPVAIQEFRLEWPLDDAFGSHMCVIGNGGNYSCRYIDKVPDGQGQVWSALRDLGRVGSAMTVGSFYRNIWLGTERRGLLWCAETDEGWVPRDDVSAHTLLRDGSTLVLRNHFIGTPPGDEPFVLSRPRTLHVQYNATPFKPLTPGWRLNQVSAANGFSGGKYKVNWDTGEDYFSVLSPPFPDPARWEEYYAHCKAEADARSKAGLYGIRPRLRPYLTNQIAVRGYMDKTLEPGVYGYFRAEWVADGGETLCDTYTDYMIWLMDRQVREGGCTHFYFDISMVRAMKGLAAGMGYRLPDGRIQPTGADDLMRRWYMRVQAMLQENDLWPGGVSGHATNSIVLKALPFADSILDSEFPMDDPIDTYPSGRMIALSCPHNFGVKIDHLGFMNPVWAAMHDSGTGDSGGVFYDEPFLHFGIGADDVEFVPYWRNHHVVRRIGEGLIVSIWKRPGRAILGILNHGPDPRGHEKPRPCELTLDLGALGVPRGAAGEQVRAQDLYLGRPQEYMQRYLAQYKWWQDAPGEPDKYQPDQWHKPKPEIEPVLDLRTGALTGFDIQYHDARFVLVTWDDRPVDDRAWKDLFPGPTRRAVLNWGINRPDTRRLDGAELARCVSADAPGLAAAAWKRPGTVLLRIENPGEQPVTTTLKLDLARLGVKVRKLWEQFTGVTALDGRPAAEVVWEQDKDRAERMVNDGTAAFDGWTGELRLRLAGGQVRVLSIDTY